jgi:hypothetical protein
MGEIAGKRVTESEIQLKESLKYFKLCNFYFSVNDVVPLLRDVTRIKKKLNVI